MIIQTNYSQFIVFREDSLSVALQKIGINQHRIAFVVSENGTLEGVLTDGDIRRWLMEVDQISLDVPIGRVMNAEFISASATAPKDQIAALLGPQVVALPLLDDMGRITAVALPQDEVIRLGDRRISESDPAFLIAEIGNNHNGDLAHAIHLIDLAADAGADCAKFQMRDMSAMYRQSGDGADEDLGAQYTLDLLARFQLSDEELFRAFDHCQARGLVPLCTPWDASSLEKLHSYGMPGFKVASADFTNYDFLAEIATLNKPMICSTGMSSESEVVKGVEMLNRTGCPYVLLHCNSTYPTPDKDVNLRYLARLQELSHGVVGYSGHERGFSVPIAAVALGAKVIEKHFTTDRSMEGNDHKVSLLPDEFADMARGVRQVEAAMGSAQERSLSQGEMMNREVLAKSLIAKVDILAGVPVTAEMLDVKSPGQGLQPNRKDELIGVSLKRPKAAGDYFFPSDLSDGGARARAYTFDNKWGVPVRYHDALTLAEMSNMDLLEIHLSYKDMELAFRDFIPEPLDLSLVVHAPELFAGDHTLDLCSADPDYRARSIRELQRVIDLSRELAGFFKKTETPLIVTNVGGFSTSAPHDAETRVKLYGQVEESLAQLDRSGVEIIPQTMPPFPWHFGGQQFHNLFVDADEIDAFCQRNNMRVCLDVSHSKLACREAGMSFRRFLETVAPHAAHYHLADAKGVDGEGIQIGDGEIDWIEMFAMMRLHSPDATFIPEIWQGHKNDGEGAWRALAILEQAALDLG